MNTYLNAKGFGPRKRDKCSKCGKSVKWAIGSDDQYFLIDLPEQTRHVCPRGLKFVPAKK